MGYVHRFAAASRSLFLSLRPRGGGPSGASAHVRVASPSEIHPLSASPQLRPGGGGSNGAPAHKSVAARSELYRARTLAPARESRPVVGGPVGVQLAMKEQKCAHAANQAEAAITTGMLAKQKKCGPYHPRRIWERVLSSKEVVSSPSIPASRAPTPKLCPGGGRPSGMQLPSMGQQNACLAVELHVPPTIMGILARKQLSPPSKHYFYGKNPATRVWKKGFSSSAGPQPAQSVPVPPPPGWQEPYFDEPPLRRSGPPGYLEPDFAKALKTLPAVVPQVCVDESTYAPNYEPLQYIEALPLVRRMIVHGVEPSNGIQPSVLFPVDTGLHLLRSLLMLARSFHLESYCLPELTLNDLVISGEGRFRLRGSAFEVRAHNVQNAKDVYANIKQLFNEMLTPYGKTVDLPGGYHQYLSYQLENCGVAADTSEYLIYFNAFFLPLGNKGVALVRIIDFILWLAKSKSGHTKVGPMLSGLPYMGMNKKGTREWIDLVSRNVYLMQWMDFRDYGDGRLELLRLVRNVLCHKLEYGQSDKFVDFLIFATFPDLLPHLQLNLWTQWELKRFQPEELFPHSLTSEFPELM